MRARFEQQLQQLNTLLVEMGQQIETAICDSVRALNQKDVDLAKKTILFDDEIDRKEMEIESLCLKLLLQQQPVARDLRQISAALKMITDMERIGDQAGNIAEIVLILSHESPIETPKHIAMMAEATAKMVTESVKAFVKKDEKTAFAVIAYDDVVDELFARIKSDLIALISADNHIGEQALDLMMVAKYLERIGDHAVNIAEWVVFSITGEHVSGGG